MSGESHASGGPIDPDNFPVPDIHPGQLEYRAGRLRSYAADISQAGSDIKGSWGSLRSCYSSPEAEVLFTVVDPVATDGESVATGADKAATALETFAEEVRALKEQWATLTADANAFLASIEGDDDWRKGGWFGGESEKVEELNLLRDRVDALRREYEEAALKCANAINADLAVRTEFVHGGDGVEAGFREYVYGYDEDLSDFEMPWGEPAESDQRWYVDVAHSVVDFAVGSLEDLGGAVGAHSSEGWFEMDWSGALLEYHGDNLKTLGAMAGMYDPENETWGLVSLPTLGNTWKEVAHAFVPWEEWDERPGYVIGTAALNIGSIVLGAFLTATGVGSVVGLPLLAWRGMSIFNKIDLNLHGGVDGSTPRGIDVQLRLDLPHFGSVGPPLAHFHFDPSSLSSSERADFQSALERLERANEEALEDADSPSDPTTQDLDDALTVEDVLDPTSAAATHLREEYEGDFLENDVRDDGAPRSWEASETDGVPEGDEGLVPALVGPRADADEGAGGPDASTDQSVDLSGNGEDFLEVADGGEGRVPVVNDSVGHDRPVDTPSHEGGSTPHGNDGGPPPEGSDRPRPGDGHGGDADTRTGSDGGDLTGGRDDGPADTPLTDQPAIRRDSTDPEVQRLIPGEDQRFGDGVDLEPNSRYTLYEADDNLRTEYVTDADGDIREIRVDSRGWEARHPELMNPRPDMVYNVDGYTYRTDEFARTTSVEGTLRDERNVRNRREQEQVNSQGQRYYELWNERAKNGTGELVQYQEIDWDGGHLIGASEFFGVGERLNQVAMRFDVNKNRTEKALHDIPEEIRGGIEGSFRNIERSWKGILRHGASWRHFNNPKFNDGSWNEALTRNPDKPKIDVKITNLYDPDMPPLYDKDTGEMVLPPPSTIEVQWSLNGVDMKVQKYNNVPPLAN